MHHSITLAILLLSALIATVSSGPISFGPGFTLGPAKKEIISTTTTIYPGRMPPGQTGYLFVWLGITSTPGDLIQSIVGSYPPGHSQCTGPNADTTWCISSEVYTGAQQLVSKLQTADPTFANGIRVTYTLADKATYLWTQTVKDAVTGTLLSSFSKTSGPMVSWLTATECQDFNGRPCKGTVAAQTYADSTIVLAGADSTFGMTLVSGKGVTHKGLATADGGKTWKIEKINIPAQSKG